MSANNTIYTTLCSEHDNTLVMLSPTYQFENYEEVINLLDENKIVDGYVTHAYISVVDNGKIRSEEIYRD